MSETKRPTREGALKVLAESGFSGTSVGRAADNLAALFGGFAPEPAVQLPFLAVFPPEGGISSWKQIVYFDRTLTTEQQRVVAARSNAWPRVKELLSIAKWHTENGSTMAACDTSSGALDLMSGPEFGIGPDLKS